MRLRPDTPLAGRTAREIRPIMRQFRDGSFTAGRLAEDLELTDADAAEVVSGLLRDGLIEAIGRGEMSPFRPARDPEREHHIDVHLFGDVATKEAPICLCATTEGLAVANASFARPVKRETAQRNLDAFLDRVTVLNTDPSSMVWVKAAWLFGSFARPDVDPMGDVDVIVRLGHRGGGLWEALDALQFLKGGSRVMSIHDVGDLNMLDEHSAQGSAGLTLAPPRRRCGHRPRSRDQ